MLEAFSASDFLTKSPVAFGVWRVVISISNQAETFKHFKVFSSFGQIIYDDFTRFSAFKLYMKIVIVNSYYAQLVKIRTFIEYWIDTFYAFILPRYSLLLRFVKRKFP